MNKHHIWASAFAMLALTYGGKLSAQGRLVRPALGRPYPVTRQYAATFEGRQAVGGNAVDRVALR